jgi:hypothetical protein
MLAVIRGIQPKDQLETLLAAQMATRKERSFSHAKAETETNSAVFSVSEPENSGMTSPLSRPSCFVSGLSLNLRVKKNRMIRLVFTRAP